MSKSGADHPILFFDGVCNLCNAWVDFVVRHDSEHRIQFASLQGSTAQNLLGREKIGLLTSVVLITEGQTFEKSDAILKLFSVLGGLWMVFQIFWIVPRVLRDGAYDFIAKNRYRWFGKKDQCRLPKEEEKEFFLE